MKNKNYYSSRTGILDYNEQLQLDVFKEHFLDVYNDFKSSKLLEEYFGTDCENFQNGKLGNKINSQIFRHIKKRIEWGWDLTFLITVYSEDDLFDIIEFLYNHCSKPYFAYDWFCNHCGEYHMALFDEQEGKRYFREKLNPFLSEYKSGFELSKNGEILSLPDKHLEKIFEAEIPSTDKESINKRIELAISKFRRHNATIDQRKDALRDLADVLEFLKNDIKNVLDSKDASDLFNIANNFGIRHHNEKQKTDYDKLIFYSWIFYYYLASIHAIVRLVEKNKTPQ